MHIAVQLHVFAPTTENNSQSNSFLSMSEQSPNLHTDVKFTFYTRFLLYNFRAVWCLMALSIQTGYIVPTQRKNDNRFAAAYQTRWFLMANN